MEIRIENARAEDFPALLDVQKKAFLPYASRGIATSIWTEETLDELTRDAREKTILVAKDKERRIAGAVRFAAVEGVVFVRKICVHPDYRRHGVGRSLLLAVERHAPPDAHKISLCTLLLTHENIPFFLRLGYRPETVFPDHYHHIDLLCFGKYPGREPHSPDTP